jgi:hypothetical protein
MPKPLVKLGAMLKEVEEALGMAIDMGGIYAADALGAFEQLKQ